MSEENEELENSSNELDDNTDDHIHDVTPVSGMYENWFLEYASYVILERAVPAINDGLKPVQRRILHSMKEMDDGRFNKVANVIGHTMSYHPHGDAAIGDAIVNLGQKDLLIETQGNWGDINTGDSAAAARYIEARLSKLAHEIVFNPQTTEWQSSYDGRKKEPVTLPVKFPLVLAQGVEGIAVGLATKIMPHNFIELCEASIQVLKGKKTNILPDFLTGGQADFSNYNGGERGGKIRVRAKIEEADKKTLLIKNIPFGTTTSSVIDSIIKANDNGKIKVRQVVDNTAAEVEIEISLPNGVSPSVMIDALYAFTDCEVSISPNCCVIIGEKPHFMNVNDILKTSTHNTVDLLKRELEIRRGELMEKIFFSSLEKIFIQEEMYINFKEYDNKPDLFKYLDQRFEPFKKLFYRDIEDEDFEKLTQIPMIRITRFDTAKADEKMRQLEEELKQVEYNLENLIEFSINYFQMLIEKFGKGKERKTEIAHFENIQATVVAANNAKLYVNRKEGFIGTGLKKDEYICDCSDIDDVIIFRKDGKYLVTRLQDKVFVGKDIIHIAIWKKGDERMTYNLTYLDGLSGKTFVKRFNVTAITRDREYDMTKGEKKSKIFHFTANPNGEADVISVYLTSGSTAKKKVFDYDFSELAIKGRGAGGNVLTKYPVRKIELKSKGKSTLGGLKIWYDETVGRLNKNEIGQLLGEFEADDKILVIYETGEYELTSFDLMNKYDVSKIEVLQKFDPNTVINVIHQDGESKICYVKRFKIETLTMDKRFSFINESEGSKMLVVSTLYSPQVQVTHKPDTKGATRMNTKYNIPSLIDVKGWKAQGNKLTNDKVFKVQLLDPDPELEAKMKAELEPESLSEEDSDNLDVGTSIDLDVNSSDEDKDQLGLF